MAYYCTIEKEDDEYIAQFPDMPNIVTCGFSHEEALAMAKEALDGCLEVDISGGNEIPPPSYTKGYPVSVASHIVLSLRLRELRGIKTGDLPARVSLLFFLMAYISWIKCKTKKTLHANASIPAAGTVIVGPARNITARTVH